MYKSSEINSSGDTAPARVKLSRPSLNSLGDARLICEDISAREAQSAKGVARKFHRKVGAGHWHSSVVGGTMRVATNATRRDALILAGLHRISEGLNFVNGIGPRTSSRPRRTDAEVLLRRRVANELRELHATIAFVGEKGRFSPSDLSSELHQPEMLSRECLIFLTLLHRGSQECHGGAYRAIPR